MSQNNNGAAFGAGAGIGALGGLIGLGGAELRLPLLIGVFGFQGLAAIILNKALTLIVVITALPFRTGDVPFSEVLTHWPVIVNLWAGSLIGAWVGAAWATRLSSRVLYQTVASMLLLIAVVFFFGHARTADAPLLSGWLLIAAGVVAGFGIGVVAAMLGVAGGELLIPTLILLFGLDVKLAGSMSLAVSLPTMLVGFTRYSLDQSFSVLRRGWRFLVVMAAGSVVGSFIGGRLLLGVLSNTVMLPIVALVLVYAAWRIWRHDPNPSEHRASDGEKAHGGAGEEPHHIPARIAQKLRGADIGLVMVDPVPAEAAVLRRDRIVIGLALAVLTAIAWSYLLWLLAEMDMAGMDMSGFRTIPAGGGLMMPTHMPWLAKEFAFVFAMWAMMMVAMMTPSAAPMVLTYARVGRAQGTPLAATVWFIAGYFLVWVAYSLLATMGQWALERTGLLNSEMASTNHVLAGLLFVAAGSYEWTVLKHKCLSQCQTPFLFLTRQGGFRRDAPGSVMLGLRHGAYCVGCCWALMALLFVGGVMNVLWIGLLASFILLEKVTPRRLIPKVAGAVLIGAGTWLLSMGMGLELH